MGLNVSAILLAAGLSRRMGRSKPLLPLADKPVIRHCVDALISADIKDIVVVVNASGSDITGLLRGLPVTIAVNDAPDSDMAGSVRVGLRALNSSPSGVLAALSDHPLVSTKTIRTLVLEHNRFPDAVIVPEYRGRHGHPSLFPKAVINEIFHVSTLRDIVTKDPNRVRLVPIRDQGVVFDMDTPEDYRGILQIMEKQP